MRTTGLCDFEDSKEKNPEKKERAVDAMRAADWAPERDFFKSMVNCCGSKCTGSSTLVLRLDAAPLYIV